MAMKQLVDIMPVAQPAIQYKSMSDLLKSFRQYLEREAGTPWSASKPTPPCS